MKLLKRIALSADRFFENFAMIALAAMTLIVTVQVFTRKLFDFVFFWSEEITLLLLVWFGFMGIAVGFREKLHLAMDAVAKRVPPVMDKLLDRVISASIFAFGLYLVKYGWDFTRLMHANKLPATEWPVSVMYVVMPLTGLMICTYAFLQFWGISTERHRDVGEEQPE